MLSGGQALALRSTVTRVPHVPSTLPGLALALRFTCSRLGMHQQRRAPKHQATASDNRDDWKQYIAKTIQGLKSHDQQAQKDATMHLAWVCMNPDNAHLLGEELITSGAIAELSKLLKHDSWLIRREALSTLWSLVNINPDIAAGIPPKKTVPLLVKILQKLVEATKEGWWSRAIDKESFWDAQAAAAGLLGAIAVHQPPGPAAAKAVPYLSNLLDVGSDDNAVRINAARALGNLVARDPSLHQAMMDSGAVDKLVRLLDYAGYDVPDGFGFDTADDMLLAAATTLSLTAACSKEVRDRTYEQGVLESMGRELRRAQRKQAILSRVMTTWNK